MTSDSIASRLPSMRVSEFFSNADLIWSFVVSASAIEAVSKISSRARDFMIYLESGLSSRLRPFAAKKVQMRLFM